MKREPSDSDREAISVGGILESVQSWGVPHFQRGSVWGSENVSALLESLYYDTPCGSIILWTPRDIDRQGVPLVKGSRITSLLIDGQQRTRSVHAAFRAVGNSQRDARADEQTAGDASVAPIERHWAINLAEVGELERLVHRPEKRVWPLFVHVPDAYLTETRRLQKIQTARSEGNTRYTVPESPFKYNFVPLHLLLSNEDLAPLLEKGRIYAKRLDGTTEWTRGSDLEQFLEKLETVRAKVHLMKSRRLFRKVLGEEISLNQALRIFVRINSGGRPVQEEEKGFSVLVGRSAATSDWVRRIFEAVHKPSSKSGTVPDRDDALRRMQERGFGFKLFIRVFMLAASYHTNRVISGKSLSFSALQDRRSLALVDDESTYDRLWTTTSDVVLAVHKLLQTNLNLDALQFLPETASLFPVFLLLVKYPALIEEGGTSEARVRRDFEAGIAKLALLLLLRDAGKQKSLAWANDISAACDNAGTVIERIASRASIDAAFLEKRLRDANSLNNRYTLLLYALQRIRQARDFRYADNALTGPLFDQPERELAAECHPEKQHIVPYSHLIGAYGLEFASRVSSTEANNIGNITYISHYQNSLGGLADRLLDLHAESPENLRAHFLEASRDAYDGVKALIGARGAVSPETLKKAYQSWTQLRRGEINRGFSAWLSDLDRSWVESEPDRRSEGRVDAVPPIRREPGDYRTLAHALQTLNLPDSVEDALQGMFLTKAWQWKNAQGWQPGSDLVFALLRNRRISVNNVRLSAARLVVPGVPGASGVTLQFAETDVTPNKLTDLMAVLEKFEKPKKPAHPTSKPKTHSRANVSRAEVLAAVGDLGGLADEFASLVEDIAPLGIYAEITKEGVALRLADPGGSNQQFRIARLSKDGTLRTGLLRGQLEDRGYATDPSLNQARTLSALVPGASVDDGGALLGPGALKNKVPLAFLLGVNRNNYRDVIRQLVEDIRESALAATRRDQP